MFSLQLGQGFWRDSMGPDQNTFSLLNLIYRMHCAKAQIRKPLNLILIVNQHSKAQAGTILQHTLRHTD
jgi:hypothetical protein